MLLNLGLKRADRKNIVVHKTEPVTLSLLQQRVKHIAMGLKLAPAALAAWSANGGTVEFERLNVEWGALEIAAEGTLTLDGALRPEGAFSAEIAGYGGLLDGLAERGRMKPRDASFAKTFLNLMAKKKAGRRVIAAPVTAQNGKLFVGPLPLLKLAPMF